MLSIHIVGIFEQVLNLTLSGSAFCTLSTHTVGVFEQARGWLPLGLGLSVEAEPFEFLCDL